MDEHNQQNQNNSGIDIDKEIMMGMLYDSMNGMDYLMQQYGDIDDNMEENNQEEIIEQHAEPENLNQSEDIMNILDEELSNLENSMQNQVHHNSNISNENDYMINDLQDEDIVHEDEFNNEDFYDDMPGLIEEQQDDSYYYAQNNDTFAPLSFSNNFGNTFFTVSSISLPGESFNINNRNSINSALIYTRLSNSLANSINIASGNFNFATNQNNINFENLSSNNLFSYNLNSINSSNNANIQTYTNIASINNIMDTLSSNEILRAVRTLLSSSFSNFETLFNGTNVFDTSDVAVTLNKESLDSLESIRYGDIISKNKMQKCTICLEDFKENDMNIILHCNHHFHSDCVKEWLSKHSYKCPICRIEVGESEAHLNQNT